MNTNTNYQTLKFHDIILSIATFTFQNIPTLKQLIEDCNGEPFLYIPIHISSVKDGK